MRALLALSLFLNVAAVGTASYLFLDKRKAAANSSAEVVTNNTTTAKRIPGGKRPSTTTVTNLQTQKVDWRMVESEDYRQYIANLRSIGCPEETIRDIIVADVNKLFEARRKQMAASSTNKFQFWKASNMFANMLDEEKIKQKQALAKEKRDLLIALLGTAPDEKADMGTLVNPFSDMLDFLPDGKQRQVVDLLQTYQAKAAAAFKDGAPDAQDFKQMQKVQKEMEAELAKILSPQELEDYQLRLSQTAMIMRMQLGSFDPNEQEFRDIFKLRKQFEDEYGLMGMGAEDATKRKEAEKQMKDQIKELLGADRYADYERAQDYTYQGIAKAISREGLPKESAVKVYDMKKTAEDEMRKVRNNKQLTTEQRDKALDAIRAETEKAMIETMGQKAFDALKKQNGWMKGITLVSPAKS
jgi:hypothetical protein